MNKRKIAITIGDIKGIGIELLISLWKLKKINNFILVTNADIFINYLNQKKINLPIKIINNYNDLKIFNKKYFTIFNFNAKNTIENSYFSLYHSHKLCIKNYCYGIITLPLNKEKISNKIDRYFIGQTEYFQNIDKKSSTNMIFYSKKFIVSPLSTHLPINQINTILSNKKYIYNKIKLLHHILKKDFNINKPKIILLGVNPHAGENGLIGKEEIKYFSPVIKKLKNDKLFINGPISPDSAFNKKNLNYYDCFVCAYHDQALIPFKILNGFKGVNYTGNLNFIRLSPTHGTAYDQVGKKTANYESLLYCFKIIKKIFKNRK